MVCTLNGGSKHKRKTGKRGKHGKHHARETPSFLGSLQLFGKDGVHSVYRLGKRTMKYGRTIRKKTFGFR